jgi:hypothetical protein
MIAAPAQASRPVTDAERAKLVAVITADGCSGGKMVWDDTHFEVDEVVCSDGRRYDMKFDADFRLVDKRPER